MSLSSIVLLVHSNIAVANRQRHGVGISSGKLSLLSITTIGCVGICATVVLGVLGGIVSSIGRAVHASSGWTV